MHWNSPKNEITEEVFPAHLSQALITSLLQHLDTILFLNKSRSRNDNTKLWHWHSWSEMQCLSIYHNVKLKISVTHLMTKLWSKTLKHHGTTTPLLFRFLKMVFRNRYVSLMKTSHLCWLYYLLSSTERTTIHGELLSSFKWSIRKASVSVN